MIPAVDHGGSILSAVARLDAAELDRVAAWFNAVAAELRSRAKSIRQVERRSRAGARAWSDARRRIARMIELGASAAEIAEATGQSVEAAEFFLKQHRRQAIKAERRRKEIEAMRLARLGYSNAAIAGRLALHPMTVSRIVRKAITSAGASDASSGRP